MAALTRAWLAASLPPDAAATGRDALAIVGVGTLYDLCFAAYALLPGALFLWLCPEALWRRAGMRRALHVLCFLTLFGFAFIAAAEVLFWNEFGARLNFISVDYLVYRREVTQNILESYPVGLILAGLVVASLASYGLLARRLHAV